MVPLTAIDVVDCELVEDAIIAGTTAGLPTIRVLNTTCPRFESLTFLWCCSSIGDLRETARNRSGAYSHVDRCEQLANRAESVSLLSLLDIAVCQRINLAMSVR